MGLLDLPGPLFGLIDQLLGAFLPGLLRLVLWGILAGWLTMLVYRRLSNQERIGELKAAQKAQQRQIAEFDGELQELFPMIRQTLALGVRQLGLSLGPALLATLPVLFLVVWVAGAFGYQQPPAGTTVAVTAVGWQDNAPGLSWQPRSAAIAEGDGWRVAWPQPPATVRLSQSDVVLLELPSEHPVPVIHKRYWWNWLMANPIGYLPEAAGVEVVEIDLPPQQFLSFGPGWMRGWMFSFFMAFLLSSIAFKFLLRID